MNFFSAGVDEQAAVRELREAAPAGTVLWGQDLKAETPGSDYGVSRKYVLNNEH